jgi:arginine exporter protein ArgO
MDTVGDVSRDAGALLAGLLAGLAVAAPLGAISVLILTEGLTRGWRSASAAATGVALVDLGYAAVATAAGSAVTALLDGRTRAVQLVGAAVLVAVSVYGLLGLRRGQAPSRPPTGSGAPATSGPTVSTGPMVTAVRPAQVLRRFVAMTAINPLTAIYFVVLAAGLGQRVAGWRAGAEFVLGVFAASLCWQLALAASGSFAGARLPGWARTGTSMLGYLVVLGYAVRLGAG